MLFMIAGAFGEVWCELAEDDTGASSHALSGTVDLFELLA
jgi:hypothetical protein